MPSVPTRYILTLCLGLFVCLAALAGEVRILVQSSPLAGFRYYAGETLWHEMREGDRLTLVRETDNEHDGNAVRVEWRGQKLGYLPRAQNRAVAAARCGSRGRARRRRPGRQTSGSLWRA